MNDAPAERSGFRAGLVEPNLVSILVAAVVVAAGAGGLFLGLDEGRAASHLGLLGAGRGKHAVRTTTEVLALRENPPTRPTVLVLGSSAIRNCVDVALLEESLAGVGDDGVEVVGLCSGGQPIAISHGILEHVPDDLRGVVLLGVGIRQFSTPARVDALLGQEPRLGLRAEAIDAAIRDAGAVPRNRAGLYAWDNRTFIVPRLMTGLPRNLFHRSEPFIAMPRRGRKPHGERRYAETLDRMRDWLAGYADNADRTAQQLDHVAAHLAARDGLTLVMIESPINPALLQEPGIAARSDDCRKRLDAIAARHGAPFLRMHETAALLESDFLDATHLRTPESSARYTERVADVLTRSSIGLGIETGVGRDPR